MKMDEKTIKEILLKGERVTLECKKAKSEMPKSRMQFIADCSATLLPLGGRTRRTHAQTN